MTRRLILTFALLGLLQALLVGWLVQRGVEGSARAFLRREAVARFGEQATQYYRAHGGWAGFGEWLGGEMLPPGAGPQHHGPPPTGAPGFPPPGPGAYGAPPPEGSHDPRRPPGPPHPPARFGLVDEFGRLVLPNGERPVGTPVGPAELAAGIPLDLGAGHRATILLPAELFPPGTPEQDYLMEARRALLVGLGVALALSLVAGVWAARAYTRPLRELTTAVDATAAGGPGRQVPVRGSDEPAALARAFNAMSQALQEAETTRRHLTADIAHELRTPLTVLTGTLEALRDGTLPVTPHRVSTLHDEALRLQRLVEDLRTLSLVEAHRIQLTRSRVDLAALLERTQAAFEPAAAARDITLSVQASPEDVTVMADADRLTQVLVNLVANALRHTPANGRITLEAHREAGALQLRVTDTGPGISEAALPHLFDRFYRADPDHKNVEGSGLGLNIARSLVELHGGTLSVTSAIGAGSTFTVTLPPGSATQSGSEAAKR